MFLYNITIKVENAIHQVWLSWMSESFIPKVMQTGKFIDYTFYKLLNLPELDGETYALQLFCASKSDFDAFKAEYEEQLHFLLVKKFEDRIVFFPTLMEKVST